MSEDMALAADAAPGCQPPASAAGASSQSGIPSAVSELRDLADALKSWFDSMVDQRNGWNYPRGVEVNARDALEASFRVANAVYAITRKTADALASAMSAGTDETAQQAQGRSPASATGEAGDATPKVSPPSSKGGVE